VILVSDDGNPIGVATAAVVVGGSALVAAADFAGAYLVDPGLAVGNFGSVAVLAGVSDGNESERSSEGDQCDEKCFHDDVRIIFSFREGRFIRPVIRCSKRESTAGWS
jgi:hypothetical protein